MSLESTEQASGRACEIVALVNDAFPDYGGPIISPLEMANTGKANCFGRLATIGAGLILDGLPDENIHWLINLGHGHGFNSGRRTLDWFGHVELVVDDEKEFVVDALFYANFANIDTISWRPRNGGMPLFVIDEPKQISAETGDYMEIDGLQILQELPEILALSPYFGVHTFAEGIEFYQATHGWYKRQEQTWRSQDYAWLYESLISHTS